MNDTLIKILAIVIIVAALSMLLRSYRQEYAFLLVLAAAATVLIFLFSSVFPTIDKVRSLFEKSGNVVVYFATALKALGIAYITNFAADVCRDFGHTALAQIADVSGKCAVFVLSLPLMSAVLETALRFAKL